MPAPGDAMVLIARVRTMDPQRPLAEAMAVADGRILSVGSVAEVRSTAPAGTPVEDLGAATITPGLIDTHLHLQRGGLKIIHDMGPGPHALDEVVATMRETGFGADWGPVPPTPADRAAAMRLVQPLMHELGITGVIDPAVTAEEMAGYQDCRARGELTMRVVAMPYPDLGAAQDAEIDTALERLRGVGLSTGFGDALLRVGGVKVYFDGEAMKGQALLAAPWPDGSCGVQRIPTAQFQRLVDHCAATGWSVGVHAVGGAAVDTVLDCFERADARHPIAGRNWQLIHAYLETTPQAMARAARLGVVAAVQPSIVLRNGAGLARQLGEERAAGMNPLRSWIDSGALVVLGSDGPFFPFDPRELMASAITRRVRDRAEPLSPAEAITADEALACYTRNAAVAAFDGDRRGMLRPGGYADWVAFDADPVATEPQLLPGLQVLRTVVGGRTVFTRNS